MIEKKFEKKNCKVTFVLDKNDFSEFDDIRVLGDFNGWHYEKGLIMELKKGQFKSSVTLKAGINYEFRYILNGRHWFNDPQGDGLVDSPFYGISNTLVVIKEVDGSEPKVAKTEGVKKTIPTTTEKAAPAPKAEKAPAVKKAAPTPKAEQAPVVKKAAPAPKAEQAPVVKKAAPAPKAEKVPAVKKAAPAPKAEKAPAVKKAASAPKAEKAPAVKKADDLKLIEGVGPKIAELLNKDGIVTFADLSKAKVQKLEAILNAAGPKFSLAKPATWPEQAKLAAAGKMEELKKLQDELKGGVK